MEADNPSRSPPGRLGDGGGQVQGLGNQVLELRPGRVQLLPLSRLQFIDHVAQLGHALDGPGLVGIAKRLGQLLAQEADPGADA